jgi:micrococcal nuclease
MLLLRFGLTALLAAGSLSGRRLQPAVGPSVPCEVAEVVDGDTLRCRDGRKVRLIGIDSPERAQGSEGVLARRALLRLLPLGRAVRLERDVRGTDRYGRTLAYVWTGDSLINEVMVRQGWAVLYTVPPDVKYADRLERAQKEARQAKAGLWGEGGFECLPRDFRKDKCGTSEKWQVKSDK